MYMPLSNLCIDTTARTDRVPRRSSSTTRPTSASSQPAKTRWAASTRSRSRPARPLWSWETRVTNYSPVLATGGGLLFNGSMDRYLRALDADSGQVLWQTRLPSQVVGGAVTYSVNGRQYIAITAVAVRSPRSAWA